MTRLGLAVKVMGIVLRRLVRAFRQSRTECAKQQVVKNYGKRFRLNFLIETGTYLGGMVAATQGIFREIHSIELDYVLYKHAKWRFRKFPHINIHHGDSGVILRGVLSPVSEPCLFWLDAHYSRGITARGEPPVRGELKAILAHPHATDHVVLIDDARSFGSEGYPTLDELQKLAPGWVLEEKDGIIRMHHRMRFGNRVD